LLNTRFKERYSPSLNLEVTDIFASRSFVKQQAADALAAHKNLSVSDHAEQSIITKHIKDSCITQL
jgi:hypothetical protein